MRAYRGFAHEIIQKILGRVDKLETDVNGLGVSLDTSNEGINNLATQIGTEKSERQLTDNNLATQISTEKYERQLADDSLLEQINTEKSERQAEIAIERARINQLATLEGGSTTGDAELQDIRIDASGNSYSSAGNAVRGQILQLLNGVTSVEFNSDNTTLTIGKTISDKGIESSNSTTAITPYIRVFGGEQLITNVAGNDEDGNTIIILVAEYTSDRLEYFVRRSMLRYSQPVILKDETKYVRFSVGRLLSSKVNFTEADFKYFDVKVTNLYNRLTNLLDQTLYKRFDCKSADSMDRLTDFGIYGWTDGSSPYDCPVSDSGLMMVIQLSKSNNPEHGRLMQIIMSPYGLIYRYRWTSYFGDWQYASRMNNRDSLRISALNKKNNQPFTVLKTVGSSSEDRPFVEGTERRGVPYKAVHYYSRDAYFNFNMETVFSMFNNKDSVMYNHIPEGKTEPEVYTGGVCSSYVSWITNQPIYYTTYDVAKMLNYKNVVCIEDIEIGDVLICHTTFGDSSDHVAIVSNIITDGGGICAVEISEQWPTVFQSWICKRDNFVKLLNGTLRKGDFYKVGRFDNQTIRSIPEIKINTDIITEYGDNTYFELGDPVFIKSANRIITVKHEDGTTFDINLDEMPVKDNTEMCNISSVLTSTGRYTLYGTNGEESHITIIQKGFIGINDNTFTCRDYSGCRPCGYAVVVIRDDGRGNYETHINSDEYTAGRLTIYSKEDPRYAGVMMDDSVTINISAIKNRYVGYYVRVFYDTGCGQAFKDSDVILF